MNAATVKIKSLLTTLKSMGLLKSIYRINAFYDEPQIFHYGASLDFQQKYSDGLIPDEITASGLSFNSANTALLKCLGESIERYCLYCYKESSVTLLGINKLGEFLNTSSNVVNNQLVGCVSGYNTIDKTRVFIPAQLVYLNYKLRNNEARLFSNIISTGAAGGFNANSTILRGIYEIIERDAFMTTYLNKISHHPIDLFTIHNEKINFILNEYKRYNLQVFLFNITNDLFVPTFLTISIDPFAMPILSLGLRSDLRVNEAIIGSLEEAILTRSWIRKKIVNRELRQKVVSVKKINTLITRAQYWLNRNALNTLSFLLRQRPVPLNAQNTYYNDEKCFDLIINTLMKKNLHIYHVDITHQVFKKSGYLVYKVLIPELQPLYLKEQHPEIRRERLRAVAKFFGKRFSGINQIPHPFL